jgi:glycosyltransferase involved in cell wall biosynthesis
MMDKSPTSFSVVIPTFGREGCVHGLLASLGAARECYCGSVEIIVVDSSHEPAAKHIAASCEIYGAIYCQGEQSVRWKRNYGARKASYPVILFIDSDCEVDPDIFGEHAGVYESGIDRLGGVYGLTRFVGRRSFLWRIIEQTPFVDVFSFAEQYPFVQWAIGNNISYYKSVLEDAGGFDEGFPFRLGGDDLDLSLRVTTAGYLLKTNPRAVTYHTRDTWNSWRAILERAMRWGRMEYYIYKKYPQLLQRALPEGKLLFIFFALLATALSLARRDLLPLAGLLIWFSLASFTCCIFSHIAGQRKPLLYSSFAKIPAAVYQLGTIYEFLRHGRMDFLYKRMIFSVHHIRSIWPAEMRRLWAELIAFWAVAIFYALLLTRGVAL